jgi:c-di-GMP-binding flagellar brake protein YcgR
VISRGDDPKPRYGIASLERRKYKRYSVNLPAEYHRVDSLIASSGQTGNISGGGLLLYSQEKMDVEQQLRLRVFFSLGPEMHEIEALVEITWVGTLLEEKWGSHSYGVKFVRMSPEDRAKLEEFLKTITP